MSPAAVALARPCEHSASALAVAFAINSGRDLPAVGEDVLELVPAGEQPRPHPRKGRKGASEFKTGGWELEVSKARARRCRFLSRVENNPRQDPRPKLGPISNMCSNLFQRQWLSMVWRALSCIPCPPRDRQSGEAMRVGKGQGARGKGQGARGWPTGRLFCSHFENPEIEEVVHHPFDKSRGVDRLDRRLQSYRQLVTLPTQSPNHHKRGIRRTETENPQ